MSEREDALKLAERLLDVPYADPDDELRMLSRQLLRRTEDVGRLKDEVAALNQRLHAFFTAQATEDLIESNRDQMLKMHEEAVRRTRRVLRKNFFDSDAVLRILDALSLWHPMHDDWKGWPKESDA